MVRNWIFHLKWSKLLLVCLSRRKDIWNRFTEQKVLKRKPGWLSLLVFHMLQCSWVTLFHSNQIFIIFPKIFFYSFFDSMFPCLSLSFILNFLPGSENCARMSHAKHFRQRNVSIDSNHFPLDEPTEEKWHAAVIDFSTLWIARCHRNIGELREWQIVKWAVKSVIWLR